MKHTWLRAKLRVADPSLCEIKAKIYNINKLQFLWEVYSFILNI